MIIGLQLEEMAFEQDIRELLMAFYPGAAFWYPEKDIPGRALKGKSGQTEMAEAKVPQMMVTGQFLKEGTEYRLTVRRLEKESFSGEAPLEAGLNGRSSEMGVNSVSEKVSPEMGVNSASEKVSPEMGMNPASEKVSPVIERGLAEARENAPFAIISSDHGETKNRIKRRLYFLLMLDTGRQLPWGALTGIRPVKIPEGKLAEGWDEERISSYMEVHYLTGEKKRKLSLEIAKEERRLLNTLNYQGGYSLYVGIPFCPTTCLYCSFTSYPIRKWESRLDGYLESLEKELLAVRDWAGGKRPQTVYVGGGTPTSLPEAQLERLMEQICSAFGSPEGEEFTVEAGRPDSITREKLQILKDHGVSRISINPQSMNQKTLDLIGRLHTVEQVEQVFWMARETGFDNINMDIILGLPGEGRNQVVHTLERIRELKPDSLTVHCLALKRAARLNLERERYKEYPMASGSLIDELAELAAREAGGLGMKPYYLYRQKNMAGNLENVGYASGDKACLYNILMMEEKQTIVACGAGSVSKRVYPDGRIERCENVKDVASFIERIDEMIERKRKLLED